MYSSTISCVRLSNNNAFSPIAHLLKCILADMLHYTSERIFSYFVVFSAFLSYSFAPRHSERMRKILLEGATAIKRHKKKRHFTAPLSFWLRPKPI
jgi:hypothetical protein